MGVLKKKDERTETLTLRLPSSLKKQIDQLRQRAETAGFDLTATISDALTRLAKQVRDELDGTEDPRSKKDRAVSSQANGLSRTAGGLLDGSAKGASEG
jgi:hypothetical protein